ncbi:hypothetical protein P692DRAFT_201732711, partial [Suillus brevipes Sb2]
RIPGDGSEWTINEDWEARTGLVNDIMHISEVDSATEALQICFTKELIFLEVVEAIYDLNHNKDLGKRRRAKHRASEYLVDEGKLWRLRNSNTLRAKSRVECVIKEEAKELARQTHSDGGHWGRDAIKLTLLDRICSPKLDASILEAIKDCAKCKNFGPTYIHILQ